MPHNIQSHPVKIKIVALASLIILSGNACAYMFQLLAAHGLSTADFGAASALLNLSFFMIAPFAGAQLAIAKMLIDHGENILIRKALVRRMALIMFGGAVALFISFRLASGFLISHMQIDPITAGLFTPLLIAATFLCLFPMGLWQAERAHLAMSLGGASIPVLRLVLMVICVNILMMGLHGAMLALGASCLIMIAGGIWFNRHYWQGEANPIPAGLYRQGLRFFGPASLGSFSLLALTYMDVPLVRMLVEPDQSGLYAAASTLAKIPLLLPAALINIVFPEAASLMQGGGERHTEHRRLILVCLALTLASSGLAALVMMLWPDLCFALLGGGAYRHATGLLQCLAPAMAAMAVITLIVTYAMACNRMMLVCPCLLAVVLVPLAAISGLHTTQSMATIMLLVLGLLALLAIAWLIWFLRQQSRAAVAQ